VTPWKVRYKASFHVYDENVNEEGKSNSFVWYLHKGSRFLHFTQNRNKQIHTALEIGLTWATGNFKNEIRKNIVCITKNVSPHEIQIKTMMRYFLIKIAQKS
jgi:hypothetical protein